MNITQTIKKELRVPFEVAVDVAAILRTANIKFACDVFEKQVLDGIASDYYLVDLEDAIQFKEGYNPSARNAADYRTILLYLPEYIDEMDDKYLETIFNLYFLGSPEDLKAAVKYVAKNQAQVYANDDVIQKSACVRVVDVSVVRKLVNLSDVMEDAPCQE